MNLKNLARYQSSVRRQVPQAAQQLDKFWFPYKVAASFQEGTQMGGLQHWYCGMRKSQKIYVYCISILLIPIAGVGLLMLALLFYLKLGSDKIRPSFQRNLL